jgi:acyl-CoA thioesterase-2
VTAPALVDLLTLDPIEVDLYRATVTYDDQYSLYGGQVAAQALRAAAHTVGADRRPHSLHGYFLSPGDASRPVLYKVHRDRDGRSYSNRRVVAIQGGRVILNLTASFQVPEQGPEWQPHPMPEVAAPDESSLVDADTRLLGVEVRVPPQEQPGLRWPTRSWMRCREPLTDEILQACVLTYLSDIFTGLSGAPDAGEIGMLTSLDHAMWFHRPAPLQGWVLMDLEPESISGGRGMYTGRLFARDGTFVAGIAQESLYRRRNLQQP